jgi:hypothetical protein
MFRETHITMSASREPIVRTYFDEADFELAFVTTTDLEGNVQTHVSTGHVENSSVPENTQAYFALVERAPIPVTENSMLAQHRNAIASSQHYLEQAQLHFAGLRP